MNEIISLSAKNLRRQANSGLGFQLGPFNILLKTSIEEVTQHVQRLYAAYPLTKDHDFIDFYVDLSTPSIVRRYIKPQVNFYFDGYAPFKPLPYIQAAAMFEWGLNWCIANHSNQYLIIHAAVVERNGQAFIFPGTPGSGKSTLCAALINSGWRLLSDEMTLLSMADGQIYPVPRPVSLKNQSIDIIRNFAPNALYGQTVKDTAKGTVGHMAAPERSVHLSNTPALPSKLIFPKYIANAETQLIAFSKGRAMLSAAENSFNYNVLGAKGFESMGELIGRCDCYEFKYSQLEEAISLFTQMSS